MLEAIQASNLDWAAAVSTIFLIRVSKGQRFEKLKDRSPMSDAQVDQRSCPPRTPPQRVKLGGAEIWTLFKTAGGDSSEQAVSESDTIPELSRHKGDGQTFLLTTHNGVKDRLDTVDNSLQ